jgi:hypothetical protein
VFWARCRAHGRLLVVRVLSRPTQNDRISGEFRWALARTDSGLPVVPATRPSLPLRAATRLRVSIKHQSGPIGVCALALLASLSSYWAVSRWVGIAGSAKASRPTTTAASPVTSTGQRPTAGVWEHPAAAPDVGQPSSRPTRSAPQPRTPAAKPGQRRSAAFNHRSPPENEAPSASPEALAATESGVAAAIAGTDARTVRNVVTSDTSTAHAAEPSASDGTAAPLRTIAAPPLNSTLQHPSVMSAPTRPAPGLPLTARAQIRELSVRGPLVTSVIRRAIERIDPLLNQCYARCAQTAQQNQFGSIHVDMLIDEVGRVRNPQVQRAGLPGLDACVTAVVAKLVSGAPDTGTAKVSWNIHFAP